MFCRASSVQVDGGFDVGREPSEAVGVHLDTEMTLPGLGPERSSQALVREQRRVDAAERDRAGPGGRLRLGFDLSQELRGLVGVARRELAR